MTLDRHLPARMGAPHSGSEPDDALDGLSRTALGRATGSAEIPGNAVELQFDGPATFETWIDAISSARSFVHFENYILRDDHVGRRFRDALVAKAREGVTVRVLYDWVGCWATPRRYWKPFREAGVQVRAFNRPSIKDPYGVFQRDHRKLVAVDGCVAFVGGFCIGAAWAGDRDNPPWRDTGVAIRGPAATVAATAFERIWNEIGPIASEPTRCEPEMAGGETSLWIMEGEPGRTRVMRTLALIASHARHRLWITDPYFVAPRLVSEALAAAARDGVDVRVLLPANNNWPLVGSLSRTGYRFLLSAGVRIFEWNGPMIHAKTSVADGVWSRVGSSNLNSYSLLGNWEIDVGIWDASFAGQLEGLFLADLTSSVEIVLPKVGSSVAPVGDEKALRAPKRSSLEPEGGLSSRLESLMESGGAGSLGLTQLVRAGSTWGWALAGRRTLGREDRTVLGTVSAVVLALSVFAAFFPRVVGWGSAVILGWLGVVTGVRALLHRRHARIESVSHPEDEA